MVKLIIIKFQSKKRTKDGGTDDWEQISYDLYPEDKVFLLEETKREKHIPIWPYK